MTLVRTADKGLPATLICPMSGNDASPSTLTVTFCRKSGAPTADISITSPGLRRYSATAIDGQLEAAIAMIATLQALSTDPHGRDRPPSSRGAPFTSHTFIVIRGRFMGSLYQELRNATSQNYKC